MRKVFIIIVMLGIVIAFFFPSEKNLDYVYNKCFGVTKNGFQTVETPQGVRESPHKTCFGIGYRDKAVMKSLISPND